MPTPCSTARRARSVESTPRGSVSQEKNPPCGASTARLGQRAPERGEHALALAAVERPRPSELLVDPASAVRLLEEPLAERARALVGVLLGGDELRRDVLGPDRPAEPDAGEEGLRGRPRLDDDVRAEAPEAQGRFGGEAELAVGDILDEQEAVAARELDQRLASLGGEADAGGVLVVGDRVDELRAQAAVSRRSSSSTSSP